MYMTQDLNYNQIDQNRFKYRRLKPNYNSTSAIGFLFIVYAIIYYHEYLSILYIFDIDYEIIMLLAFFGKLAFFEIVNTQK